VTVTKSIVEYNGSLGISTSYCDGVALTWNTIRWNSATGLVINDGTRNLVHGSNLSYCNYSRQGAVTRAPFCQVGWSSKVERDILMRGTLSNVQIETDNYQ